MAAPENRQKQVTRKKRGQFAKGSTGNPGARPKQLLNCVFFWRKERSLKRISLNFTSVKG